VVFPERVTVKLLLLLSTNVLLVALLAPVPGNIIVSNLDILVTGTLLLAPAAAENALTANILYSY
jgi:hypothetical protein